MTDGENAPERIVERLRAYEMYDLNDPPETSDMIRDWMAACDDAEVAADIIAKQEAEIARYRQTILASQGRWQDLSGDLAAAEARERKLREALASARTALRHIADTWGSAKEWPGGDIEEAASYASVARAALTDTASAAGQACDAGDVRRKALDEAARIAEHWRDDTDEDGEVYIAAKIADAIRSLIDATPQPVPTAAGVLLSAQGVGNADTDRS